jgi:hypothetical protein
VARLITLASAGLLAAAAAGVLLANRPAAPADPSADPSAPLMPARRSGGTNS